MKGQPEVLNYIAKWNKLIIMVVVLDADATAKRRNLPSVGVLCGTCA